MRMIITFLAAILFCPFSSFLVLTISASLPQPLLCINRSILIFLRKTLNTVIEVNIHDLFICDDTSHLGIKCPASKPLFQKDAVLYLRSTSKCLHRKSSNGKRPLKTKSSVDQFFTMHQATCFHKVQFPTYKYFSFKFCFVTIQYPFCFILQLLLQDLSESE